MCVDTFLCFHMESKITWEKSSNEELSRSYWPESESQALPWLYWSLWGCQFIVGGNISWVLVLICVNIEKGVSRNRHTYVWWFLLLTADVLWLGVLNPNYYDLPVMIDFSLEFWTKVSPFPLKLLFIRMYCHSNLNEASITWCSYDPAILWC